MARMLLGNRRLKMKWPIKRRFWPSFFRRDREPTFFEWERIVARAWAAWKQEDRLLRIEAEALAAHTGNSPALHYLCLRLLADRADKFIRERTKRPIRGQSCSYIILDEVIEL